MSKHAQLADGTTLEFPDDTPDSVIELTVKRQVASANNTAGAAADAAHPMETPLHAGVTTAIDQGKHVAGGMLSAITGIPGMIKEAGGIALDALNPDTRVQAAKRAVALGKGAVDSVVAPIATTGRGIASAIDSDVKAPTTDEWHHAADAAGSNLGQLLLAKGLKSATPEAMSDLATRARMARAGAPGALESLAKVDVMKPGSILTHGAEALHGTAGAAAGVTAPILEKLAAIRSKMTGEPMRAPLEGPSGASVDPVEKMREDYPAQQAASLEAARAERAARPAEPRGGYDPNAPTGTPSEPTTMALDEQARNDKAVADARALDERLKLEDQNNAPDFHPEPGPSEMHHTMGEPPSDINAAWQRQQMVAEGPPTGLDTPIPGIDPDVATAREALLQDGVAKTPATMERAAQNAKFLLEAVPELRGVKPGFQFNTRLFNALDTTGHELRAVQDSIPKDTPVPMGDSAAKFAQIQKDAALAGDNAAVKAVAALEDLAKSNPTAENFFKAKQGFFDRVKLGSQAGRAAYQVLKDIGGALDPKLKELNQKWYTLKTSSELANMSPFSGEKLKAAAKALTMKEKPMPKPTKGFRAGPL